MIRNTKSFIYALAGHLFIHYENTLLAFIGPLIAYKLFPEEGHSVFNIYFAIAAGYWLRPFGAVFFSWIGDRFGRRPALLSGYMLLIFPAIIVGFLPEYSYFGYITSIIVIASRVIQGISLEGVFYGNITFVGENSSSSQRNLNTGLILSVGFAGALMGTLLSIIFLHESIIDWGWRVPFIFGGVYGIVLFALKNNIIESKTWEKSDHSSHKFPFLDTIKEYPLNVFAVFIYGMTLLVPFYISVSWLPPLLKQYYSVSNSFNLTITSISSILSGGSIILFSWLSTYIGTKRLIYMGCFSGIALSILFYFLPALDVLEFFVAFQLLSSFVLGVSIGPVFILIQSLFPPEYKYSGFAVPSSLGQALLIGSTPLIATTLNMHHGLKSIAFFLIATFLLTILATYLVKPIKKTD